MKPLKRQPGDITPIALESDLPVLDEVYEFSTLSAFPKPATDPDYVPGSQVPEIEKIYIADDTGKIYHWTGSAYGELARPTPITLRVYDDD